MERLITFSAVILMFLVGCSKDVNINAPVDNQTNEPNWFVLPQAEGMRVNTQYSISKYIKGKDGGDLHIREEYAAGPFGKIKIDSKIKFPHKAFDGEKLFTMTVEQSFGSTTFLPHSNFNFPANFDLEYEGLDLTGLDISKIDFVYLNEDGTYESVEYDKIKIDVEKGKIEIKDAKLPHFSRYGFIRKGN